MGVKVTICGREYSLKANTSEDERSVKQIAGYIDTRMEEVAASIPGNSFEKTCVLTSLNLAAELLALKNTTAKVQARLERLLEALGGKPQ